MDVNRHSDSSRAAQIHIYDEVPREDMDIESEDDPPTLPPKTTRSPSDKKNNNEDSPPVNLALNREEEFMLFRKKKFQELRGSQKSRDDNNSIHRGIARHESAPARNGFPHVVKRRVTTEHDDTLGEPQYQDPDDIRNSMAFKGNLKTQTSLPCIPQQATYEEADPGHHSLGFSCEDEGEYWSIPRDTFCDSGDYAEWPIIQAPHNNFPGKPFAQSTLKKQMSTSTTSSSRTDSSMVSDSIKTYYEDSISSAAESPDLPKKFSRPTPKSRRAFNHYTKIVMHEREVQTDPENFQAPVEDNCSQTIIEVKSCCSCGDMVYISEDALRLRDLLKFEQSQRLMAEQLFKLAEREVMDLQSDLDQEKKITERLSTDLIKTKVRDQMI